MEAQQSPAAAAPRGPFVGKILAEFVDGQNQHFRVLAARKLGGDARAPTLREGVFVDVLGADLKRRELAFVPRDDLERAFAEIQPGA